MRLISQDGKYDIPYEYYRLSVKKYSNSFCIVANREAYGVLLGEYLTEDKAKRVLKCIRAHYEISPINSFYLMPTEESVPTDDEMKQIIDELINC